MELTAFSCAVSLIKSFCGAVGSLIGSQAISQFCKEGVPSYFPKVYQEIGEIVGKKLAEETVEVSNKNVKALIRWVTVDYTNLKDSGASNLRLHAVLEPRVHDLVINVLPLLQDSKGGDSEPAALGAFVLGACIHLKLLQELAMVDPNVNNPLDSYHIKSLQEYADGYAKYAEQTFDKIISAREKLVTDVFAVSYFNAVDIVVWMDKHLKEKFATTQPTVLRHKATSARSDYLCSLRSDLSRSLYYPRKAALVWRLLLSNPLTTTVRKEMVVDMFLNDTEQESDSDDEMFSDAREEPSPDSDEEDCFSNAKENLEPEKKKKMNNRSVRKRFKTWILFKLVDVNKILKRAERLAITDK